MIGYIIFITIVIILVIVYIMSDDSWRSKYRSMKKLYIDTKREFFKHFGGDAKFSVSIAIPEFKDGDMLDKRYAAPGKKCGDGNNIFPTIAWENVPADTKTLALIVDDPDAPGGTWTHLVAWNIDPSYEQLDNETLTTMVQTGKNSSNNHGYNGPCPPSEDAPHHYHFTLYALNKTLDLNENSTVDDLRKVMDTKTVLAEARATGLYKAPEY
jgi:Raf kinase inhibitor-like YbhB/YbcL family protein